MPLLPFIRALGLSATFVRDPKNTATELESPHDADKTDENQRRDDSHETPKGLSRHLKRKKDLQKGSMSDG